MKPAVMMPEVVTRSERDLLPTMVSRPVPSTCNDKVSTKTVASMYHLWYSGLLSFYMPDLHHQRIHWVHAFGSVISAQLFSRLFNVMNFSCGKQWS